MGEKQASGRGKLLKLVRVVCKRVGHLVKDCRDKSAKEAWLAKREKKERREDDDSSRGRKHDRSEVIRGTTREAGARSVNVAAASPANAVTGATAQTIASLRKKEEIFKFFK